MQAFHCLFGVGCLLAPIISEPFLLKKPDDDQMVTTIKPEWISQSANYSAAVDLAERNVSMATSEPFVSEAGESQVMYAYLITGVLMLLTGCALVWTYLIGDKSLRLKKKQKSQAQPVSPDKEKETVVKQRVVYIAFLVLLALFFVLYVAMEMVFGTFLMTFAVKQLGWSKTKGAAVTTAFMGAFTGGRGLGIILVTLIRPSILLTADLILCVIFSVILTGFVNMHVSVLWICSVGLGLGMATVYATGFTWTETYIGVSGKVSAMILVASAVGEMAGPASTGPLMEKVGYISYVYVMLGTSLACLGTIIALQLLGLKLRNLSGGKLREPAIEVEVDAEDHYLTGLRETSQELHT